MARAFSFEIEGVPYRPRSIIWNEISDSIDAWPTMPTAKVVPAILSRGTLHLAKAQRIRDPTRARSPCKVDGIRARATLGGSFSFACSPFQEPIQDARSEYHVASYISADGKVLVIYALHQTSSIINENN